MPVFVIPGNHDRRENFRAALKHLPGVTADPHLFSTSWTTTRSAWSCWTRWCPAPAMANCVPSNSNSSIARWPRPGQAHHHRHASPAVRLRHAHMDRSTCATRRPSPRSSPATAGRADHLRPPPPADRGPGGARHGLDLALGGASGRDVARSETTRARSFSSRRLPAASLDRRPTASSRTPSMSRFPGPFPLHQRSRIPRRGVGSHGWGSSASRFHPFSPRPGRVAPWMGGVTLVPLPHRWQTNARCPKNGATFRFARWITL